MDLASRWFKLKLLENRLNRIHDFACDVVQKWYLLSYLAIYSTVPGTISNDWPSKDGAHHWLPLTPTATIDSDHTPSLLSTIQATTRLLCCVSATVALSSDTRSISKNCCIKLRSGILHCKQCSKSVLFVILFVSPATWLCRGRQQQYPASYRVPVPVLIKRTERSA